MRTDCSAESKRACDVAKIGDDASAMSIN